MTKALNGVSNVALGEHSEGIEFDLDFAGEDPQRVRIASEAIPKVIQTLMHFRSILEKQTAVRAANPHDLASPWRTTGVQVGRTMLDQTIALRFETLEQVPIVLTMPEAGARSTIQQLEFAIGTPSKDQRS